MSKHNFQILGSASCVLSIFTDASLFKARRGEVLHIEKSQTNLERSWTSTGLQYDERKPDLRLFNNEARTTPLDWTRISCDAPERRWKSLTSGIYRDIK